MTLKTLFATASFGNGHHATCEAMEKALAARRPLNISKFDVVDAMTPAERTVIGGVYNFWLEHHPQGYDRFYRLTDHPATPERVLRLLGLIGKAEIRRHLLQHRPQLMLHTFPSTVATAHLLRREYNLRFCNVLVVTDQRVHRNWARPEADLIILPNHETKAQMLQWGVSADKLHVCGLPLRSEIGRWATASSAERKTFLQELGFSDVSRKTVLIAPRPCAEENIDVLRALEQIDMPLNVMVMHPLPETQAAHLQMRTVPSKEQFVDALAAADVMIGKAGGVTTAECAALGLPMVIYRPLPAQEEHNARYFVKRGAALWPKTPNELRQAMLQVLQSETHARMSTAAHQIAQVNAADCAADRILQLMEEKPWLWQKNSP